MAKAEAGWVTTISIDPRGPGYPNIVKRRRVDPAAQARLTAADASRGRYVTTMADGARLRPVALREPGVRVGQDQARARWAAAEADMARLDARLQVLRERQAGIASALRLMGR